MESEDRKFPIWTLFSLLPGFHAHVRADCSRPSCRLRAGNRETSVVVFLAETRRVLTEKQALDGSGLVSQQDVGHHQYFKRNSSFKSTIPFSFFNFARASFSFHLPSPLTQLHLLSFCPFGHILPAVVSLCCSSSCSAATPAEGQTGRKQRVSSRWGCVFTDRDREIRESLKDS